MNSIGQSLGQHLAIMIALVTLTVPLGIAHCSSASQGAMTSQNRTTKEDSSSTNDKPALPNVYRESSEAQQVKRTIQVKSGATSTQNLQSALDSASAGDVIVLEAGATFVGNFTLPKKSTAQQGWIVIRSTVPDSQLPPKGVRVNPVNASTFPKIVTPNADPAINAAPGAHHFRFIGIECTVLPKASTNYGLITFGSSAITSLEQLPHDFIIDRCFIHGNPTTNLSRGVALNCAGAAVIDSYISECHGEGFDTQAIACWNGSGPFNIFNNYLEAAGENVLFGGADPKIPNLVPSDIVFTHNTCSKPLSWKPDHPSYAGKHWSVKNLFELKNARRVLIEGNLFEHNWADAQVGIAILFTPRNQEGSAPWSVVEDVSFRNNVVRQVAGAINILGVDYIHPSQQTKRIEIRNNLFVEVNGKAWGNGNGVFLTITEAVNVILDHNTVLQSGNIISAYGKVSRKLVFTNNILQHNQYGIIGDNTGTGWQTLDRYFQIKQFKHNAFIGGQQSSYPLSNFFFQSFEEIGFTNPAAGLYELLMASPLKGRGTDGKDVGCDMDDLRKAMDF